LKIFKNCCSIKEQKHWNNNNHNVQETLAITDKTYLMFEGGILKAGIPEELVEDEMVRRVYLGQNFERKKS
jgi:lipopolysaccharide export system ATP-binding protein